jgi:hypothetical protein
LSKKAERCSGRHGVAHASSANCRKAGRHVVAACTVQLISPDYLAAKLRSGQTRTCRLWSLTLDQYLPSPRPSGGSLVIIGPGTGCQGQWLFRRPAGAVATRRAGPASSSRISRQCEPARAVRARVPARGDTRQRAETLPCHLRFNSQAGKDVTQGLRHANWRTARRNIARPDGGASRRLASAGALRRNECTGAPRVLLSSLSSSLFADAAQRPTRRTASAGRCIHDLT